MGEPDPSCGFPRKEGQHTALLADDMIPDQPREQAVSSRGIVAVARTIVDLLDQPVDQAMIGHRACDQHLGIPPGVGDLGVDDASIQRLVNAPTCAQFHDEISIAGFDLDA